MSLQTDHLRRTADTLEQALAALGKTAPADAVFWDLYRNAAIKSFELSLETAGKLLRRALKAYTGSPRVRISAHRDRRFRDRDRTFRPMMTAHFGAS